MTSAFNKIYRSIWLIAASLVIIILISAPVAAQDPGDPGDLGPTPSAGATGVPIDGGASLLAVAGAGYAGKRLKAYRKKEADKRHFKENGHQNQAAV
ncbi:MAG: hypothetical protein V4543_14755 [Bacteroidota bacterium]